jgi:hypothetical protein
VQHHTGTKHVQSSHLSDQQQHLCYVRAAHRELDEV